MSDSASPIGRAAAEPIITEIVKEVLRRDAIAPDADMFDLGATSLAFIRIIAQINERFGVSLTGSELGDVASIQRLAEVVEDAQKNSVTSPA